MEFFGSRPWHREATPESKRIAEGGWQMGFARAWLLGPNRDPLRMLLPSDGEPSRLAVAWAWALDPHNEELLMFAGDGIFRISVERA